MQRQNKKKGCAALCIGGGMGIALYVLNFGWVNKFNNFLIIFEACRKRVSKYCVECVKIRD
jgi:hypothetical protein